MAIKTELVEGFIFTPDGTPVSEGFVRFQLSRYDTTANGVIAAVPRVDAPIEEDGSIAIPLWPNDVGDRGTFYRVSIYNRQGAEIEILGVIRVDAQPPVGDEEDDPVLDLADLLAEQDPGGQPSLYKVMTQAEYDALIAAATLADSEGNATLARKYAINPEDDPVVYGEYSSLHYAAKSKAARLLSEGYASSANTDADRAEIARDAAFASADVYPDIATGRAAVADGEQFIVVAGDVANRYRRDSASTQTLVASYPAAGIVPVIDGGIGALAVVIGQVVKQVNGGRASLAGGSLSDPALRIGDIAIYSAASNTVSIGIAGVEVARFTAQGMTVYGTVTEIP